MQWFSVSRGCLLVHTWNKYVWFVCYYIVSFTFFRYVLSFHHTKFLAMPTVVGCQRIPEDQMVSLSNCDNNLARSYQTQWFLVLFSSGWASGFIGFEGANAHAIILGATESSASHKQKVDDSSDWILSLSNRTQEGLDADIEQLENTSLTTNQLVHLQGSANIHARKSSWRSCIVFNQSVEWTRSVVGLFRYGFSMGGDGQTIARESGHTNKIIVKVGKLLLSSTISCLGLSFSYQLATLQRNDASHLDWG